MSNRKYLPTFAELVDRMTICQLKAIFIPENKEAYDNEIDDIKFVIQLKMLSQTRWGRELILR